jgi:hypothetical protein
MHSLKQVNKADFTVIEAKPAGCTLAFKHSQGFSRPSVVLVEAGSDVFSHTVTDQCIFEAER